MKNKASKSDAVELIRQAVADGWTRSVTAIRLGNGEAPFYVQVGLSKSIYFDNGYLNRGAQIIVGFTVGFKGRRSVQVNSRFSFQANMQSGLWSAQYQLNQMREV